MKLLALIAVITFCSMPPFHQQKMGHSPDHAAQPESPKKETQNTAINTQGEPQQTPSAKEQSADDKKKLPWGLIVSLASAIATVVLAIAAIVQSGVSSRTLDAIKRQTDYTEISLQQWVNLTDWKVKIITNAQDTFGGPMVQGGTAPCRITFRIVNPTAFPLTLESIIAMVDGGEKTDLGLAMLPFAITPGNPYIANVHPILKGDAVGRFNPVDLQCSVLFTDALKRQWEQKFGRMIWCDPTEPDVRDTCNWMRRREHSAK